MLIFIGEYPQELLKVSAIAWVRFGSPKEIHIGPRNPQKKPSQHNATPADSAVGSIQTVLHVVQILEAHGMEGRERYQQLPVGLN